MNNKEFNTALASRIGLSQRACQSLLTEFAAMVVEQLEERGEAPLFQCGSIEVKQKEQRIIVNPSTKHRMLVPPKLVPQFRPSQPLKNKIKDI